MIWRLVWANVILPKAPRTDKGGRFENAEIRVRKFCRLWDRAKGLR